MEENELHQLPANWAWSKIEDLVLNPKRDTVDGPFGSNLHASEYVDTGIPIIRLQNIDRNEFIKKNMRFIRSRKAEELKRHSFVSNDIVITKLGVPVGKACIVPNYLKFGIIVADVVRIRINDQFVLRKYLTYSLNSFPVINQLQTKVKGTTRPRVNLSHIRELMVPIAPINEQKRVISKIEELFKESKITCESLDKISQIMKRFRQSVLAVAFRGELIPQNPNIESTEKLLGKIREERRKEWEKELKSNEKDLKKIKYQEPEPVNTEGLPKLPTGWIWSSLDAICSKVTDGTHFSPPNTREGKIPYVTAKNIRPWGIDLSDITYVTKEIHKEIYSRCNPEKGDVLYIKDGVTTGLAAVNELDFEFSMLSSLALLKPLHSVLDSYYLKHYLNNPLTFKRLTDRMTGTAIKRIILDRIRKAEIALPSIEEQRKIVQKIEELFSFADQIEKSVERAKKRADKIDQAILAKAFRGELMPQDPKDEPASVLLERIKQEKKIEIKSTKRKSES